MIRPRSAGASVAVAFAVPSANVRALPQIEPLMWPTGATCFGRWGLFFAGGVYGCCLSSSGRACL